MEQRGPTSEVEQLALVRLALFGTLTLPGESQFTIRVAQSLELTFVDIPELIDGARADFGWDLATE